MLPSRWLGEFCLSTRPIHAAMMQHHGALLLWCLHCHEPHRRPRNRFTDRFCIGSIILATLDVGLRSIVAASAGGVAVALNGSGDRERAADRGWWGWTPYDRSKLRLESFDLARQLDGAEQPHPPFSGGPDRRPVFRQVEAIGDREARAGVRERQGHCDLAVVLVAELSRVLPSDAHRVLALLWKASAASGHRPSWCARHPRLSTLRLRLANRLECTLRLSDPALTKQHSCSFDHRVGAGEEGWRHRQVEGFGRLEINGQLKPFGLLDGKIGRLHARQYFVHVGCRTGVHLPEVRPVANQEAGQGMGRLPSSRRKSIPQAKSAISQRRSSSSGLGSTTRPSAPAARISSSRGCRSSGVAITNSEISIPKTPSA